ncbi:MAG: GTPase ObgE [Opitutales bacterium]|nr:GTPase ObgE [Opitutales bacterium]
MFIDEARVKLRAGNGGHGCVSFRREKYLPKGGPDGGDGGDGGAVILECDENVSDLRQYHFTPHWEAKNGRGGQGSGKDGKNGADRILKVPPGTVVVDNRLETIACELLAHGERLTLLKGGRGGWGNTRFKTSVNRAPRQFKEGEPGQRGEYTFILKTLADVAAVGFPNAGKSTLVGMLTAAAPKTAAYPFTTIHPNVGVVTFDDSAERLTLADIPGLIEGAHANRGLGHRFLRHIERCHVVLHLVDMAGVDDRDPREDYRVLRDELERYDPAVAAKPHFVGANKMDEPAARENLAAFRAAYPDVYVVPVSCLLEEGLGPLKEHMLREVRRVRAELDEAAAEERVAQPADGEEGAR